MQEIDDVFNPALHISPLGSFLTVIPPEERAEVRKILKLIFQKLMCLISLSLISFSNSGPFSIIVDNALGEVFRHVRCDFQKVEVEIPISNEQGMPFMAIAATVAEIP